MSGLFKTERGFETVKLPRTLLGCKAWFKENSQTSNMVEICDIHVTDECGGDEIEYTCAMYDRVADIAGAKLYYYNLPESGTKELNVMKNVFSDLSGHVRDILFFKTRAKKRFFDNMEDVVQEKGITFEEASMKLDAFQLKLHEVYPTCWPGSEFTFPILWGSYDADRKLVYGDATEQFAMFQKYDNVMEMDLLTWKRKNRALFSYGVMMHFVDTTSCKLSIARPLPGKHESILDKIMKRNSMGFCKICHEITRMTCTRCCTFYSCGKDECHMQAWKLHKELCKEKCTNKAAAATTKFEVVDCKTVETVKEVKRTSGKKKGRKWKK